MFTKVTEPTTLDMEIDRALAALAFHDVASEDYAKTVEQVLKLHKMKEDEKPSRVSPDTAAIIGANLLGIILVIKHEHVNVITSRAMGLVTKLK